jgi:hypothetical protein
MEIVTAHPHPKLCIMRNSTVLLILYGASYYVRGRIKLGEVRYRQDMYEGRC